MLQTQVAIRFTMQRNTANCGWYSVINLPICSPLNSQGGCQEGAGEGPGFGSNESLSTLSKSVDMSHR